MFILMIIGVYLLISVVVALGLGKILNQLGKTDSVNYYS